MDFRGQKAQETLCVNNPEYFNFLLGLHEDFASSYDIDGIMWGCEKQGAFNNAFESIHNANGNVKQQFGDRSGVNKIRQ